MTEENSVQPIQQQVVSTEKDVHGYSINDVSVSFKASGEKITLPSDADLDGVRAFQFTDSADKVVSVDANGNVPADDDGNGTLQYHKKTTDITRGDFEDNDVNGGDSRYRHRS